MLTGQFHPNTSKTTNYSPNVLISTFSKGFLYFFFRNNYEILGNRTFSHVLISLSLNPRGGGGGPIPREYFFKKVSN